MIILTCLTLLLGVLGVEALGKPRKSNVTTYDKLYVSAVKAYNARNWTRCVNHMEEAIKDHAEIQKVLVDCRLECRKTSDADSETATGEWLSIDVASIMRTVNTAECIRKCRRRALLGRPTMDYHDVLEKAFKRRNPYEYLQYCYYKVGKVQLAASASYTNFLRNPNNDDMKQNIEFYRTREGVADSDFEDLESKPYKKHYVKAMTAYDNERWGEVAEEIETSLAAFYEEEERCRAECEGPLEVDETVDFIGTLADRYITLVKCQAACETELGTVHAEPIPHFVAEYYHYLQYAYYKTDQKEKAAAAVATHQLLKPQDYVMTNNKNYFLKNGYIEDWFQPRKEAVDFLARKTWMQEFLTKVKWNEAFKHLQASDSSGDTGRKWMATYEQIGLKLIHSPQDLGYPYRFITDSFLREEQCEALRSLADSLPSSPYGASIVSLKDAREHFTKGEEMAEVTLRLMLRAAEVARQYTSHFFNVSAPGLYFQHGSIVCWQAASGLDQELPCYPQEDGDCVKEFPSEGTPGEFVTVTFLSDIREDAEFYFMDPDDNFTAQMEVRPKCGRMVTFQQGEPHSLLPPLKGQRCALVVKLTSDPKKMDPEHRATLVELQKAEETNRKNLMEENPRVLKELLSSGINIIYNSTDLAGGERFAADGLADEEQCELLMNLVSSGALLGDGYEHLRSKPSVVSPHTKHELFQGLTVYRSAQLALSHLVNPAAVRTFVGLAEKVRLLVEKYFNLTQPLYFDFTHLVCRSAVEEFAEDSRDDLSHPVHADNCNLQPDGSCRREFPAFTQRDYSAILYLNEEFAGGNFFFAHPNKSEQVAVRPKCGRMVGFNAGELHGVKPVLRGRRCALAMWYTFNPSFKELAHLQARTALTRLAAEAAKDDSSEAPDIAAPRDPSLNLPREDL